MKIKELLTPVVCVADSASYSLENIRYTLAVRRLKDGDTASSVLAEFLGLLEHFDFEITALYLDRGFYDGKCLTLLQAHNYAYVVPIIR